jgi:hypothetical protein
MKSSDKKILFHLIPTQNRKVFFDIILLSVSALTQFWVVNLRFFWKMELCWMCQAGTWLSYAAFQSIPDVRISQKFVREEKSATSFNKHELACKAIFLNDKFILFMFFFQFQLM